MKFKYLIIILLSFHFSLFADEKPDCGSNFLHGYIIDGQHYVLNIEESNQGKAFISFLEGFDYRIVICSNSTQKYKVELYDIEKKMLFSGNCENFSKTIDVRFASSIACYLIIVVDAKAGEKSVFNISMGFKESKSAK